MKKQEKIDAMVEFLTESHLDTQGGYPYDSAEIGDKIVVASLDDSKENAATKLDIYNRDRLVRWYDAAKRFQRDNPDEDWEVCCFETEDETEDEGTRLAKKALDESWRKARQERRKS